MSNDIICKENVIVLSNEESLNNHESLEKNICGFNEIVGSSNGKNDLISGKMVNLINYI